MKQQSLYPSFQVPESKTAWEEKLWKDGFKSVAGLDEAGRGAWAGPVVAAAVILKPGSDLSGVDDSKKLSPQERERLFDVIVSGAAACGVGVISCDLIDELNILQASIRAMQEAVSHLPIRPDHLLIDGNRGIDLPIPQKLLVKGDARSLSIGAASIIAKVTRDRLMISLESDYPAFRFSLHKGYGTPVHQEELKKHGPQACHRYSFRPVKLALWQSP